jgi:hypothetical protein
MRKRSRVHNPVGPLPDCRSGADGAPKLSQRRQFSNWAVNGMRAWERERPSTWLGLPWPPLAGSRRPRRKSDGNEWCRAPVPLVRTVALGARCGVGRPWARHGARPARGRQRARGRPSFLRASKHRGTLPGKRYSPYAAKQRGYGSLSARLERLGGRIGALASFRRPRFTRRRPVSSCGEWMFRTSIPHVNARSFRRALPRASAPFASANEQVGANRRSRSPTTSIMALALRRAHHAR